MTKKILLKWLEEQKVKALAQVDTQENAAKATLLAEKLERTKFAEMVAYVEPRLTEAYDYMMDWHKKNEALAGPLSMSWGTILYSIQNVLLARVPMAEKLQETELREAQVDRDLKKRFSDIRREVEKTYYIGQRTCRRNTSETRLVLLKVWDELYKLNPLLFSRATTGPFCMRGACKEGKMGCKNPMPYLTPSELLRLDYPLLFREEGATDAG